jgi:hypothetical protein
MPLWWDGWLLLGLLAFVVGVFAWRGVRAAWRRKSP